LEQPRRKQVQPQFGSERAFGEALREIRRRRELSQERLALDAGLDRTYISLLERGLRNPTLRIIVRLADVLDSSLSEIIGLTESYLKKQPRPNRPKR